MNMRAWSLRGKVVLLGVVLPTILIALLINLYIGESKEKTRQAFVSKARAICLTAESTRMEMDGKWSMGLFNVEMNCSPASRQGIRAD